MSTGSTSAPLLLGLDYKIIATALAVFFGTLITTIWGWYSAKKKVAEALTAESSMPTSVTGAVLMDNLTLREQTLVNKEVRDQLIILNHTLARLCKAIDANTDAFEN